MLERIRCRAFHSASIATGQERNRLFAQTAAQMPQFSEYQRKVTRQMPAVLL